jgi:ATP-dependent helicase/nuclease subunit B
VAKLVYWRLSGNDPAGEEKCIAEGAEVARFADAALEGLAELVRRFDDPATAYRAVPRPGWAPRYSDYAHLARVKEWSTAREEV